MSSTRSDEAGGAAAAADDGDAKLIQTISVLAKDAHLTAERYKRMELDLKDVTKRIASMENEFQSEAERGMSLKEEHDGIVQEFEEAAARAAEDGLTWTVMSGSILEMKSKFETVQAPQAASLIDFYNDVVDFSKDTLKFQQEKCSLLERLKEAVSQERTAAVAQEKDLEDVRFGYIKARSEVKDLSNVELELKQAMLALEELPLILTGHTRRADELTSAADALDGAIAKRQEEFQTEKSAREVILAGLKQANLESESSVAEAKDDLSHLESRLLALQDQIAFTTEELKHAEAEARSLDERLVLTREENAKVLADHQLEREGLAVVLQRLSVGSESKRSCEVEVTTLTEAVEAATAVKASKARELEAIQQDLETSSKRIQDVKDERAAKIAELKEKQAELEVVHRDLDAASSELLTVEAYDASERKRMKDEEDALEAAQRVASETHRVAIAELNAAIQATVTRLSEAKALSAAHKAKGSELAADIANLSTSLELAKAQKFVALEAALDAEAKEREASLTAAFTAREAALVKEMEATLMPLKEEMTKLKQTLQPFTPN